jgi:hypothetical protein
MNTPDWNELEQRIAAAFPSPCVPQPSEAVQVLLEWLDAESALVKAEDKSDGAAIWEARKRIVAAMDRARVLTLGSPAPAGQAEALIAACVPGGDTCDPQRVADAIREWFAAAPAEHAKGVRVALTDERIQKINAASKRAMERLAAIVCLGSREFRAAPGRDFLDRDTVMAMIPTLRDSIGELSTEARALWRECRGAPAAASGETEADLWRKLKPLYYSAHFFPQDMDLPEGVALIFMAPKGTRVSADLDATVAGIASSSGAAPSERKNNG